MQRRSRRSRDSDAGPFDIPQLIALAAVLGFASGIRLYAVLLIAGLVGYAGWVELPGGLAILQHPWVLAASGRCSPWNSSPTRSRRRLGVGRDPDLRPHSGGRRWQPASSAEWTAPYGRPSPRLSADRWRQPVTSRRPGARAAANTSPEPFSNMGLSVSRGPRYRGPDVARAELSADCTCDRDRLVVLALWLLPKLVRFSIACRCIASCRVMPARSSEVLTLSGAEQLGRELIPRACAACGDFSARSHVQQSSDRQPRRNRLPCRPPRAGWEFARSRCTRMRTRTAATWRWPTKRCASVRRPRARVICAVTDHRSGQSGGAGDPSRLRFPVGERAFATAIADADGLHRTAAGGDPRDGQQERSQEADGGRANVPLVPGYHGDQQQPELLLAEADRSATRS